MSDTGEDIQPLGVLPLSLLGPEAPPPRVAAPALTRLAAWSAPTLVHGPLNPLRGLKPGLAALARRPEPTTPVSRSHPWANERRCPPLPSPPPSRVHGVTPALPLGSPAPQLKRHKR
jgi:hypothetical protein